MFRVPVRNFFALLTSLVATLLATTALHAQQHPFPELGGAAKLVSFTGQVSVIKDSSFWALNVGDLVQPGQVVRTGTDGYAVFQVSDGSKFEVFPNAKVVFRANRGDWKDLLEVLLGKVRVQIEHWGGLPNNNKVRTPSAVISVRGTIFDVEVDEEQEMTLVVVEEGKVEVAHSYRLYDKRTLNAGEFVKVYVNSPMGKAVFDKGDILKRFINAAKDAVIQMARTGGGKVGTAGGGTTGVTSSPGDQSAGPPPPTTAPPPPTTTPPPPGAPPPHP